MKLKFQTAIIYLYIPRHESFEVLHFNKNSIF